MANPEWYLDPEWLAAVPDPDWYLEHVVLPDAGASGPDAGGSGPGAGGSGPARTWQRAWQRRAATLTAPDPALVEPARRQGFAVSARQLRDRGIAQSTVRRWTRREQIAPARWGVVSLVHPGADDRVAAALTATAAVLARCGHVVSGRSAAVLHGLPVMTLPPRPELTARVSATGGQRPGALVRTARLTDRDVTSWFGAPVTTVARTVVDLGRRELDAGLIAADAALHEGLLGPDQLVEVAARCAGWPGTRAARTAIELADPLAESPLESLIRLRLWSAGLPTPRLQEWVEGPGWRYRVDLLWPDERVVLEADGRIKYVDPHRTGDDVLWREKLRQERLERAGFRVVRVLWADVVGDPGATVERVRWALSHPLPL